VRDAAQRMAANLDEEIASGVLTLGQDSYQAIAAPILSPTLTGWVVFARRLDQREMHALESMSAIPIQATVLHKEGAGWKSSSGPLKLARSINLTKVIDDSLEEQARARALPQVKMRDGAGQAVAMVKSLKTLDAGAPAVLLLRPTPPPRGQRSPPDFRRGPHPACGTAPIIFSPEPLRGDCPGSVVVDRFSVWRDGAHAVWLDPPRVVSDRASRGDRPWVPALPVPRAQTQEPLAETE